MGPAQELSVGMVGQTRSGLPKWAVARSIRGGGRQSVWRLVYLTDGDPTKASIRHALVQFKPLEQRGPMRPIGQHHSVGRCA